MKKLCILVLVFTASFALAQQPTTPANALDHYIHNGDKSRGWEERELYSVGGADVYSILLTSQRWQGIVWKHELIVCVPQVVEREGALLFINGGSVREGEPGYADRDDATTRTMAAIATRNGAMTAILRQVPNQPLYDGLTEDALISYTLNEFRKDGDHSWPLLFPMAKSAVAAMDAVQEFAAERLKKSVTGFVVSGASKRGWTTWMTAASGDGRVVAIAPMVIDMLNMPVSLPYQAKLYGGYSDQIEDYVALEIPQAVDSEFGNAITTMIDPYSYRKTLTLPKMIVMGTNDPYWTVDVVKHYIDDIPGVNLLHYVPDAGHSLGDKVQAMAALDAFFGLTITGEPYPDYSWTLVEQGKSAKVRVRVGVNASTERLTGARLWRASCESRDFREAKWSGSQIALKSIPGAAETEAAKVEAAGIAKVAEAEVVEAEVGYPAGGYIAFYVELLYKDADGDDYSVCTQVYTADGEHVFTKD